ncbi:MAG: nucleotidyltransferase domain-containing protein, partial [Bacteroidota bacterium]
EPVRAEILDRLRAVEAEEGVRLVYACESGSRAWGFPSADSDFDIRFLYVRPPDWYLSINVERRPDVLRRPIAEAESGAVLDPAGWDLRKTLRLLHRSNASPQEWLRSPIVYREDDAIVPDLRALAAAAFRPLAAYHHYRSMAKGTYLDHLSGATVNTKKYFYALRPLLNVRWIEAGLGPVPTAFSAVLDAVSPPGPFRATVDALIDAKRLGSEDDAAACIPVLQSFIESELARLEHATPPPATDPVSMDRLDAFFRATVRAVWG